MRFFTSAIVAAAAFTSAVVARAAPATTAAAATPTSPTSGGTNPITAPLGNVDLEAGKPFTITWEKTFGNKVTLNLRKGNDENDLDNVMTIAADIANSGSYSWTPSKDLEEGEDYSIEIIADGVANYSPRFTVNSEGEGVKPSSSKSASASASASASSASASASSASASASATKSASSSAEPSSEPSSTEDASASGTGEPEPTSSDITAASNTDSGAGQLSSPLALVLCIVASLVYFH